MRERHRHGGEPLGGREHEHHGVFLPGLVRRRVANAAPKVDNLPAPMKQTKAAPSSRRRKKFSSKAWRTASNPAAAVPQISGRADVLLLLSGLTKAEAMMAWSARRALMIVNRAWALHRKIQFCNAPVSTEAFVRLSGCFRRSRYLFRRG